LNEHQIWILVPQNFVNPFNRPARDVGKGLTLSHNVQVVARLHLKEPKELVKHLAMLSRDRDDEFKIFVGGKGMDDWRHLYGFWSRPENRHDFDSVRFCHSKFPSSARFGLCGIRIQQFGATRTQSERICVTIRGKR
jgi:arylamine N-acetyltransferase